MTDTAKGTSRIEIAVNTSQFDSAIAAAKRAVADMSASAQQQYKRLSVAEKQRVMNLIKQADTLRMSQQQQIAYSAALSTNGPLLGEITRKLAESTAEMAEQDAVLQRQKGMRELPGVMADIAVGLREGQDPLAILLTQGAKLHEMFGGVAPAAQAVGAQLAMLANPVTIVGGMLAGLTLAWKEGAEEQAAFSNALITTGGYAGVGAGQFKSLVDELAAIKSVTHGGATDALTAVAASGRFAGDEFLEVAEAAARMEAATGQSVDTTISKFAQIAESPVDALLRFNETEHFLTRQQLERVDALIAEGRETEAVSEATAIYKQHMDEVATSAEAAKPVLTAMWSGVKEDASAAWNEVKGFAEFLAVVGQKFGSRPIWQRMGPQGGFLALWDMHNVVPPEPVATPQPSANVVAPGEKKAREELKRAEEQWSRWESQNLSRREAQNKEEQGILAVGALLGKKREEIDAAIAASRRRNTVPSHSTAIVRQPQDPTIDLAQRIQKQIDLNGELLGSELKLSASQKLNAEIQKELLKLGDKASPARRREIEEQLKQLAISDEQVAAHQKQIKAREQLAALEAQIAERESSRAKANSDALMVFGYGADEVEKMRRQLDIQRAYHEGVEKLRESGVQKDSASWNEQVEKLAASRERMLRDEKDFQQRRLEAMGDWRNGASTAWQDYAAGAADVAGQTKTLFSNAFGGAENAMVAFAKTGKLSFSDLADSIINDLARIAARQIITGLLGNIFQGIFGGGGTTPGVSGTYSAQSFGNNTGWLTGGWIPNAAGGVYSSPSLSAYSGGIYNSPQLFAFAKGAGVFGEAGPEAIMPLTRGADGRLGVSASGRAGASVKIEVENRGQPVQARATASQQPDGSTLIRMVLDSVADDMASGGKTAQAMRSRFDVAERV